MHYAKMTQKQNKKELTRTKTLRSAAHKADKGFDTALSLKCRSLVNLLDSNLSITLSFIQTCL